MTELENLRQEIDRLDTQIAKNIKMRLDIAALIGKYKKENNLEITDKTRETKVIEKFVNIAGKNTEPIITAIINASKEQEK